MPRAGARGRRRLGGCRLFPSGSRSAVSMLPGDHRVITVEVEGTRSRSMLGRGRLCGYRPTGSRNTAPSPPGDHRVITVEAKSARSRSTLSRRSCKRLQHTSGCTRGRTKRLPYPRTNAKWSSQGSAFERLPHVRSVGSTDRDSPSGRTRDCPNRGRSTSGRHKVAHWTTSKVDPRTMASRATSRGVTRDGRDTNASPLLMLLARKFEGTSRASTSAVTNLREASGTSFEITAKSAAR